LGSDPDCTIFSGEATASPLFFLQNRRAADIANEK